MKRYHIFMGVLGLGLIFCLAAALQTWRRGDGARSTSGAMGDRAARSSEPRMRRRDHPIPKRPATAAERKAVAASITAQLKAFQKDDYGTAMRYQSAALKKNFPSPSTFRRTIRSAYPQFSNYKAVAFGRARCDSRGQRVEIEVLVTGQDGSQVQAIYHMVLEDKIFRVDGVIIAMERHRPMAPDGGSHESLFS